jgi:hypothetical protein
LLSRLMPARTRTTAKTPPKDLGTMPRPNRIHPPGKKVRKSLYFNYMRY